MTLLGKTDGADYQDGTSYLDIAKFIMQYGARYTYIYWNSGNGSSSV